MGLDYEKMRKKLVLLSLAFMAVYALTFSHFLTGFDHDEFRVLNVVKGIDEYSVPMFLDHNFYLHPPLLFYEIYLVSQFMPVDMAAMVVEIFCAFNTIIFTYLVAERFLGKHGAMMAAILVGTHYNLWMFSNRFLFEAPLLMMFTFSTYLVLKANKLDKIGLWIATGVSLGGLLLLKVSGLLLIGIFCIFLFFRRKFLWFYDGRLRINIPELGKIILVVGISFALFLPYIVYITINNAPSSVQALLAGMASGSTSFATASPWHHYLTDLPNFLNPIVFVFFLLGAFLSIRNRSRVSSLLLWLLIPILIFSFADFKDSRYINPIFPFCVIIAVYGVRQLGLDERSMFMICIFIASFGAYQSLSTVLYDGEWPSNYEAWDTINSLNSNKVLLAHDHWWATGFFTDNYVSYITGNFNSDLSSVFFYNAQYMLADNGWSYPSESPIFEEIELLPEINSTIYYIDWNELALLFPNQTMVTFRSVHNGEGLEGAFVFMNGQIMGRTGSDGRFRMFIPGDGLLSVEIKKVCYSTEVVNGGLQNGTLFQCLQPGTGCVAVNEITIDMDTTNCAYHPDFILDRY
jgi:hypothetical protein